MPLPGHGEGGVASHGADPGLGTASSFPALTFDTGLIRFLLTSSAPPEPLLDRLLGLYVGSTTRSRPVGFLDVGPLDGRGTSQKKAAPPASFL